MYFYEIHHFDWFPDIMVLNLYSIEKNMHTIKSKIKNAKIEQMSVVKYLLLYKSNNTSPSPWMLMIDKESVVINVE